MLIKYAMQCFADYGVGKELVFYVRSTGNSSKLKIQIKTSSLGISRRRTNG